MNMEITTRTTYIDFLRVFATFAVVILHVAATNFYATDVNGFTWHVFNFFDSIVRWCVPIFVMISGALFLNKNVSVKKIYTKYVLRILMAFLLWSGIYLMFNTNQVVSVSYAINSILKGYYHMWFIMMIIGIYMCIPLFKTITQEGDDLVKYYLLLSFIFVSFMPTVSLLSADFFGNFITNIVSSINSIMNSMSMNIVFGFGGYFVLGYYLDKISISAKHRKYLYILGIIGFVSTILLDAACAIKTQKACVKYYSYFRLNVLLESIAVFVWFKYRNYVHVRTLPLIAKLAKWSFGAYLVHVLVLEQLVQKYFNLYTISFNPLVSVLAISFIVCTISFVVSGLLHKIPIVNKYMV